MWTLGKRELRNKLCILDMVDNLGSHLNLGCHDELCCDLSKVSQGESITSTLSYALRGPITLDFHYASECRSSRLHMKHLEGRSPSALSAYWLPIGE